MKEIVRGATTCCLGSFIDRKRGNISNRIAVHRTKDQTREVPSIRQRRQVFSHEICCEKKKIVIPCKY